MSQPPLPHSPHPAAVARGVAAAATCYLVWGLVPLYWRQLSGIDPLELIAHRHLWSLIFALGIGILRGGFGEVIQALVTWRSAGFAMLGAVLLTTNWTVYVASVNSGHVIESSLGYFLVPLFNVAAGRLFLHEHLRRLQWLAVTLAGLGVATMAIRVGHIPWIAFALAGSWGGYGLLKKKSPIGAVAGLTVETLLLAPVAIGFLVWRHHLGTGALGRVDSPTHLLLMSSGLVTGIPLLLFAFAARQLRLSTLGLLQYLGPTLQFLLGVFHYHETFARGQAMSFALIWAGLLLYTGDNLMAQRNATTK